MESTSYNNGFPSQPGWYDVLIDGIEDRLVFRICHSCNRLEWRDINGNTIEPERVKWIGEAGMYP